MAYPIVAAAALPPVQRAWFWRPRRDPADVPPPRLGAVYVFKTEGEYVAYGQRHLDFSDDAVLDATEVYLVQLRPQQVVVELGLRPVGGRDVMIEAVFRSRVVDPVAVAAEAIHDLDELLATHLAMDPEIATLVTAPAAHDVVELRRRVEARVRAYCAVAPPEFDGIDVALSGVHVITADEIAPRSPTVIPNGGRP